MEQIAAEKLFATLGFEIGGTLFSSVSAAHRGSRRIAVRNGFRIPEDATAVGFIVGDRKDDTSPLPPRGKRCSVAKGKMVEEEDSVDGEVLLRLYQEKILEHLSAGLTKCYRWTEVL